MSENIDALRNMLITFRVSELQMLLGFAGRNKSGRKTELQQRALELLRVRSHPIHQKIRDLYKTIQQSGSLNQVPTPSGSPGNKDLNMPQTQGTVPRTTATVHPYNIDSRQLADDKARWMNVISSHLSKGSFKRKHFYVCDLHFKDGDIEYYYETKCTDGSVFQLKRGLPRLNPGCVPYINTTRQPSMYNQNVYNPYPQYAQQKTQQGSVPVNNFPVHPDVKFRRLPFFDIISDLLKPSTLVPQSNQRMQEATFYFHLTPQQATDIASSRDIRPGVKCDYVKQVQLRFCLLETTCEQDDYFPPNVIVKVNNKPCPLPNPIPTNKPGVEPKRPPRPVNITPMVKLSPIVANMITVQWAPDYGRGYAISVALVQKLTSSDLLQRLKAKGAKHSDHTRGLIKEKLKEDADSEITTTCLRVSLICPLGKMRMSTPCRAITCGHLQCFDSSLFLQMNERKPTWCCPVCDKPALYDNLVIDGYFQEVLASPTLPPDMNEIQLHKDGSWSTSVSDKKVAKSEKVPIDDSIEIIGDDVEVVSSGTTATSSTDKKDENTKEKVVDLTGSDSDDDEPLAKRRIVNPKPDSTIKFSDTTSISSSSNQSRVTTTPGPSSVSSSGYPASPSIITLDSPSPPRSPHNEQQNQPASCMMTNQNGTSNPPSSLFSPGSMPFLDLDNEAASANMNYPGGY